MDRVASEVDEMRNRRGRESQKVPRPILWQGVYIRIRSYPKFTLLSVLRIATHLIFCSIFFGVQIYDGIDFRQMFTLASKYGLGKWDMNAVFIILLPATYAPAAYYRGYGGAASKLARLGDIYRNLDPSLKSLRVDSKC